jgi:hypothetical protein
MVPVNNDLRAQVQQTLDNERIWSFLNRLL